MRDRKERNDQNSVSGSSDFLLSRRKNKIYNQVLLHNVLSAKSQVRVLRTQSNLEKNEQFISIQQKVIPNLHYKLIKPNVITLFMQPDGKKNKSKDFLSFELRFKEIVVEFN